MKLYQFQTAKQIVSGCNCTKNIREYMGRFGDVKTALLITQPSMVRNGTADGLVAQLASLAISADVCTDVLPEPTIGNIEAVHNRLSEESYDLYIGLGGGSVLDAAKILSVLRTNTQTVREMLGTEMVQNPGIPFILIPTTSGTGSEVTPNAIVTLPEEELKVGVVSKYLLPDLVFIDPVLTLTLPKPITAATGMDAFTHSFESFISNKANPISDMFALESIRLISRSITTAFHDGSDLAARENMMLGSMYGGMALSSAGTAAVHALAYPLGGKLGIPHGVANSMLLPHVTAFNLDAIEERLIPVAEAMGIKGTGARSSIAAEQVILQLVEWTKELEIPQNLQDYGVTPDIVPVLSEAAMKVTRLLNNNPKLVTAADADRIYLKLLQ